MSGTIIVWKKKNFFFFNDFNENYSRVSTNFFGLKNWSDFSGKFKDGAIGKNFFLIFEIKNFIFDEKISNFCWVLKA